MASGFKPDNVSNESHRQKQKSHHNGCPNDQAEYEMQSMDALRENPRQEEHALPSLVSYANRLRTTAKMSETPSFQHAEPSQDPQSLPELGCMRSRPVSSDPRHVFEGLTVLPSHLNRGNLLTPPHVPSIEQRRMQLSSQGLNVEKSRLCEELVPYPKKAVGTLNQQLPNSIAGSKRKFSIQSNLGPREDISAESSYGKAIPVIQDRRVPKDKQIVYHPGELHYHRAVAIEGDVADHKLPLHTTLCKDDEDMNDFNHPTKSAERAQASQAFSFKQKEYEAESLKISGNLDNEAHGQNGSKESPLPRIIIDQPSEETEHQSVLGEVEIIPSSSQSRTPQLERTPFGQKRPTSDYDALKDILLVYQGQDIASHLDNRQEVVQVAPGKASELNTDRQQHRKESAHKRSVAVHLSAEPEHQFNEIKPLNIRSKHCDELGRNEDTDIQVESEYRRSQDEDLSEYSWMSSNKDNIDSQAASSDFASRYQQEEYEDVRSDESEKLSKSTSEDEVSQLAETFSTSHLELDSPSSERLFSNAIWNSDRDFLEERHAETPFTNMWPKGSQYHEDHIGLNQYSPEENDIEDQIPSQMKDVDREGEMSESEGSETAAAQMDMISPRGRDLLPSRYRGSTPPLLFGRRPIVHKQGRRNLLNRPSVSDIGSELGVMSRSSLETTMANPNEPDWESITEQKSSEDGNIAAANKIINKMPAYEDSETTHLNLGNMSAQLAEQFENANKEGHAVTDSKYEENQAHCLTYSDRMNTSQPLRKLSFEDQVGSGDPFDDPKSESSAILSSPLTKKAYQHPSPLMFGHVAPLRGSSLLQTSTSVQDLSTRDSKSAALGSMTDIQCSDTSLKAVSANAKGKQPRRADDVSCHSSLWLSTVEERPSESGSFRLMQEEGSGPVMVSSNQEECKNTFHLPDTRSELGVDRVSSPPVTPPSRLDFANEFSSGQQDFVAHGQTGDERSRNVTISELQGENNLKFSTTSDTFHRPDHNNENNIDVDALIQSSSSNWLNTNRSQQSNSERNSMQPNSSPESENEPIDWSRAYRLYLTPLRPRQNGCQSLSGIASPSNRRGKTLSGATVGANLGYNQLTETEDSKRGKVWITGADNEVSDRVVPNQTYHLNHQRFQGSTHDLLHSPQVHYLQNGQIFTEEMPRFVPHPVYGFDCPWDRRYPFARRESPHLYAREMRDAAESRARERVYSVTFAVFCCLTVVLAPLYGHGLLDSVMVRISGGEFRQFRRQDKLFVLAMTYIILALLAVVLPITMITLSN